MTATAMPRVTDCTVESCSFHAADGCNAFAVTVDTKASCATFIPLDVKGGLTKVVTQVGACQRTDCVFNQDLECTAESVRVGGSADCLSFQKR